MSEADEADLLIWLMEKEARDLKPLLDNDDVLDVVDFDRLDAVVSEMQAIAKRAHALQRSVGQQVLL